MEGVSRFVRRHSPILFPLRSVFDIVLPRVMPTDRCIFRVDRRQSRGVPPAILGTIGQDSAEIAQRSPLQRLVLELPQRPCAQTVIKGTDRESTIHQGLPLSDGVAFERVYQQERV